MFVSASGAATAALAAYLAISLSASTAFALPAAPAVDLGLLPRNNVHRGPYSDVSFNITYESGRKAHLPKTLIMATGFVSGALFLALRRVVSRKLPPPPPQADECVLSG